MEEFRKREFIADFSKHVPKLLHHQLILEQTQRYCNARSLNMGASPETQTSESGGVGGKADHCLPYTNICQLFPSIQRFHGAVLFVDISGFTALSQKLDVESRKNHIN
eukprot:gene19887-25196_t